MLRCKRGLSGPHNGMMKMWKRRRLAGDFSGRDPAKKAGETPALRTPTIF
jgi:hypothetical protein